MTVGGDVAWQMGGFGGRARRADEHVPRRPPHARRGGDGPQRAGRRGAGRALRAARRGAARRSPPRSAARRARRARHVGRRPAGGGLVRARRRRWPASGWCSPASPRSPRRSAETPAAANGIAGAVLGAAYLLRAAGDVGDGTLSWLSPIGWAQAHAPVRGRAVVAAGAARRRDRRARRRSRSRCARAATRAPGSSRRGPARRPRRRGCCARSGSRCGCSAAC